MKEQRQELKLPQTEITETSIGMSTDRQELLRWKVEVDLELASTRASKRSSELDGSCKAHPKSHFAMSVKILRLGALSQIIQNRLSYLKTL